MEKPLDQDLLIAAVRRGLAWSGARHAAATRLAPLSPREREIFGLLVRAAPTRPSPQALKLSVKTIEDHRAAIMRKTDMNSLAQLIDLANLRTSPRPQ